MMELGTLEVYLCLSKKCSNSCSMTSLRTGQRIFCCDLISKSLCYFSLPHCLKHLPASTEPKSSQIYSIALSSALCAPYERLLHIFPVKGHSYNKSTHVGFCFFKGNRQENPCILAKAVGREAMFSVLDSSSGLDCVHYSPPLEKQYRSHYSLNYPL